MALTPQQLVGRVSAPTSDTLLPIARQLADADGNGTVSHAEALSFVQVADSQPTYSAKTTFDGKVDTHEAIGLLETRMTAIGDPESRDFKALNAQAAILMQQSLVTGAHIVFDVTAKGYWSQLKGKSPVARYGNIVFAVKDPKTAAEAEAFVQDFFAEASQTRTGRFIIGLLVKQDNGQPIVVTLDPSESKFVDSVCTSHNAITLYYKNHTINDPFTILVHEMGHSGGFYWDGDIAPMQAFLAANPWVDTDQNGRGDAREVETVVRAKRLHEKDPLHIKLFLHHNPEATFLDFDAYANARGHNGGIGWSYSEHTATLYEQAFLLERGLPLGRKIYDIYHHQDHHPAHGHDPWPANPHQQRQRQLIPDY